MNVPLFPEVTLCVPTSGPEPTLLTSRPLPIPFGFVCIWPLSFLLSILSDEEEQSLSQLCGHVTCAQGPALRRDLELGSVFCCHCLEILNNF